MRRKYSVALILRDALRADYMPSFAPTGVQVPELSAWFQDKDSIFQAAAANSSWTRPSVTSILTGTRPSVHSILVDGHAFPPSIPYLSELPQAEGYRSMAVLSNPNMDPALGFGRSYDVVHEHFLQRKRMHL